MMRAPDHKNYRECGDQFLRNFLRGLTHRCITRRRKVGRVRPDALTPTLSHGEREKTKRHKKKPEIISGFLLFHLLARLRAFVRLNRKISFPPGPAAITIPSEMPKRILRGARFATITV